MTHKTIKMMTAAAFTSLFALGTACGKADEAKKTDETVKTEEKTAEKAEEPEVAKPEVAAAPTGPAPSNDKEFLGLDLQPQGEWKPEWDPDAKVAKWAHEDHFSGIVIRVVSDKLTSMDELKAAAPMMMQIGTAISSVTKDVEKTDNGWFAVVGYDEDKGSAYINVREINGVTVVCSAGLKSSMGDPIPEDVAHKACESYTFKDA